MAKILAAVLTDPRWRALVLRLAVSAIALVALIALMMDRGIYFWVFHPVDLSTENARHTIASTIGHNGSVASLMMAGVFYALALLKMSRRKGEQYFACGCVVLFLYIIIASRTVAVWLILPC